MRRPVLTRVVLAAALLVAVPAKAPSYWRQYNPWTASSANMHLQLGSNSGTLIDGTTSWGQSAENAMAAWNSHLANFQFRVTRNSTVPTGGGNGYSNVFFSSSVYGRAFNSYASSTQSSIAAVSLYWYNNSGRSESDVVFDERLPWNSYRGAYRYLSDGRFLNDFYRVALHEFGHSLGLEHPNDFGQRVSAIMNSTLPSTPLDSLTADDIAGAQSLYGASDTTTTTTTTTTTGGVPGAPTGMTATASGSTVTLSWTAPTTGGAPTSYTIEAGSASGLSNLANFSTGTTSTSFSSGGVGSGVYYVRVRGSNAAGVGPVSNEAILTVGSTCTAPGAPSGLRLVSSGGGSLTLAWNASTGTPTTYVIEAGSAPGLSNLANSDVGLGTSFSASGVGRGTYYVRVRARGACGTSGVSNEIVILM